MRKSILLTSILLLFAFSVSADGTLTDGDATFEWYTTDPDTYENGYLDWVIEAGGDEHAYQLWFWYRIAGQTSETALPIPTSESFVGNTAVLNFDNVNGLGFDAVATVVLTDAPGNAGQFSADIAITNNTGAVLDIEVFTYLDLDKSGSSSDEIAVLSAPFTMEITDTGGGGDVCEFKAIDADALQVIDYSALIDFLEDGLVNDLDNSGLPFGPDDWTGAFQWSMSINPGATMNALSGVGGNQAFNAAVATIPTMGEWGLIILALLVLSFGTVFMMRRQVAFAGAGNVSVSANSGIPFDRTSYAKTLAGVMVALVVVFAIAVLAFGYEMTSADLPGSLIAAPIAAYLFHLLFGKK